MVEVLHIPLKCSKGNKDACWFLKGEGLHLEFIEFGWHLFCSRQRRSVRNTGPRGRDTVTTSDQVMAL